jgi:hypothetical protein
MPDASKMARAAAVVVRPRAHRPHERAHERGVRGDRTVGGGLHEEVDLEVDAVAGLDERTDPAERLQHEAKGLGDVVVPVAGTAGGRDERSGGAERRGLLRTGGAHSAAAARRASTPRMMAGYETAPS